MIRALAVTLSPTMPLTLRTLPIKAIRAVARLGVFALLALSPRAESTSLAASPDSYMSDADRIRQRQDRPWNPQAGQLGNLRHVQIRVKDCLVRIVSGTENRVFPGARGAMVIENHALGSDATEPWPSRDILLSTDYATGCPNAFECNGSQVTVTQAPKLQTSDGVCLTLQIATAHDLLIGGDGLSLLVDHVSQPAMRLHINPSGRLRVWFDDVNIGLLSIAANAAVRVGGSGNVDFLQLESSSRGSAMYMHGMQARNVGVSTTTTGTQWSIHIGASTWAGYYQPARAPGAIAKNYPIEIDGPLDRLEVTAGHVDPQPLSDATRAARDALRDYFTASAGRAPVLPPSNPYLSSASAAAATLPTSAPQRVADVVARYLPATTTIKKVTLWKSGGRLEGVAADAASAAAVPALLKRSGEFIHVSGGQGIAGKDGYAFSTQLTFSCETPGDPSTCPMEFPPGAGSYSTMQVRDALVGLIEPGATLLDVRLDGSDIRLRGEAANEADARAALQRMRQFTGLFFVSSTGLGPPPSAGSKYPFEARLTLTCAMPPKADGICKARTE